MGPCISYQPFPTFSKVVAKSCPELLEGQGERCTVLQKGQIKAFLAMARHESVKDNVMKMSLQVLSLSYRGNHWDCCHQTDLLCLLVSLQFSICLCPSGDACHQLLLQALEDLRLLAIRDFWALYCTWNQSMSPSHEWGSLMWWYWW